MRRIAVGVCVGLLSAVALAGARQATFRTFTDTVAVHATVTNRTGALVLDLSREDFEVFDNGTRRELTSFSIDPLPVSAAIVLDRSGSLAPVAGAVAAAGRAFIQSLLPGDRAALHTLIWDCQPLTANRLELAAAVSRRLPTDLGSPIWAGLDRGVSMLGRAPGRRAVILVSDGKDSGASVLLRAPFLREQQRDRCLFASPAVPVAMSFDSAASRIERDGVMLYTLGAGESMHLFGSPLAKIASRTGGRRYELNNDTDLAAAFKEIGEELHHQYLLGFTPVRRDGKVHEIDVRLKRSGLTVRARKSYLADVPPPLATTTTEPASPPVETGAALGDAAVQRAIAGRDDAERFRASCQLEPLKDEREPNRKLLPPIVHVDGPVSRIMMASLAAAGNRLPFGFADVTQTMRTNVVSVSVTLEDTRVVPGATMWLETREPDWIALPAIEHYAIGERTVATFDPAGVAAMQPGRIEIAVVAPGVERRCAISADAMRAVR